MSDEIKFYVQSGYRWGRIHKGDPNLLCNGKVPNLYRNWDGPFASLEEAEASVKDKGRVEKCDFCFDPWREEWHRTEILYPQHGKQGYWRKSNSRG